MRSFSFFATLAAAALSLAAPLVPINVGEVPGHAVGLVQGAAPQIRGEKTVPSILVDVTAKVGVAIAPLTYITKDNCTVEHITPVVAEVKVILGAAIKDCTAITAGVVPSANGILGGALSAVFSLTGNVLAVVDIANLLAALLTVIFTALGCVLKVVAVVDKDVIVALLCEIVELVCALLKIVLPLVGGLIGALLPLIANITVVVKALGVLHLFVGIGLKL